MQGVGGEVGGVELARRQAAELFLDRRRARSRAASRTALPCASGTQALPAAMRRATALGIEGHGGERSRRRCLQRTRMTSPHAAPPALPTKAPSGTGPRPRGSLRCCSKGCTPGSLDRRRSRTLAFRDHLSDVDRESSRESSGRDGARLLTPGGVRDELVDRLVVVVAGQHLGLAAAVDDHQRGRRGDARGARDARVAREVR